MNVTKPGHKSAVHAGYSDNGTHRAACGAGNTTAYVETSQAVTCKRCIKDADRAEHLGLSLKVVKNEDGSSRVVDTRTETVAEQAAYIEEGIEADEEADAEAGDLLDAALGEYVEPVGSVGQIAITKYSTKDAIATAVFGTDSIGGHIMYQRGRWVLRDGVRIIRAKTLGKVARQWAKKLGFHATAIDVDAMN